MFFQQAQVVSDSNTQVRRRLFGIYGVLAVMNAFSWLWALVAFREYPVLLGTAIVKLYELKDPF